MSKSKGFSDILRDIRMSTHQICKTEEKINLVTTFLTYSQLSLHSGARVYCNFMITTFFIL